MERNLPQPRRFGFGLTEPLTDEASDSPPKQFFQDRRNAPVYHEVSPLAESGFRSS